MLGPRILVVEDDAELRATLVRGLTEEGFAVSGAGSGAELLASATDTLDAVVVDVGLPDADGRDVCQALRAQGVQTPVLFLSARDAITDRVAGLNAGGDDYLTKPFAFAELVARLRALLRRAGADAAVVAHSLRVDPVSHSASVGTVKLSLTPTEFRLLARLAATPGETVRRRDLVHTAWPYGAIVRQNTLDAYVARLRRKLATAAGAPQISTVHGIGYALE